MLQLQAAFSLVIVLLGIIPFGICSQAENETWTCAEGWTPFTEEGDIYCLALMGGKVSLSGAHSDCVSVNASLISIHSKAKDDFVLDLMKESGYHSILIGLTTIDEIGYEELRWLRRDGNEKMDYNNFYTGVTFDGSNICTWKVGAGRGVWHGSECTTYSSHKYYCEKRPECKIGTFGGRCEKQCHCHGQVCDPQDLTGSCRFGCKRGWMGIGCDKRKENADVTYYCVNSQDHGTYVSVMIDTKGVNYRNIHGLDAHGKPSPWCNDTAMIIGRPRGFVNIQIFKTKAGLAGLQAGTCAGKAIDENTYQWTLVIQERKGILMDNDQSLLISCNFAHAETLSREGNADVKEVTETPAITLTETHEEVKLEVADAFTGQALAQTKTGSPVRLQMRFGLQQGSLVEGIVPYSCVAMSGDGKQRQPLLDTFGCQESDLVSPFHKSNVSHMIQTDWFPFFGFEGSSVVQLQCSFTFCFVECETGCDHFGQNSSHIRQRRDVHSQRDMHHSVVRRIEILPAASVEERDLDMNQVVMEPIDPAVTVPKKPAVTMPTDEERETESEESSLLQWTNYNWFLILFIIMILILILVAYVISMWIVHSSIKSIRREMKSIFYQNERLRDTC